MKIYGFFNSNEEFTDAVGVAISEDGRVIATHVSSNESFCKIDLGMDGKSKQKHAAYDKAYPDGWDFEFVHVSDNRDNHAGLQSALAAYEKRLAAYEKKTAQAGLCL